MPEIENTAEFWLAIMQAVADGRIEAKTIIDMSPEARQAFHARIVGEEKGAIAEGLAMHDEGDDK